jgi:predicted PolB exonuclease-like 3'-5' exonuclease
MTFRVLDIETIPDEKAYTPGEATYRLGADGRPEVVSVFPPPHAHRVVAISYVDIEFDPSNHPRYFYAGENYSECRWGLTPESMDEHEEYLLRAWVEGMSKPAIHLVSWNGRTFDLPVLAMRSFKHGLPAKWYYDSKDVRYRYSTEGHLDLMDFLSDFGACRPMKLNDASHLIGLPGKTDMSGASIEGIYKKSIADGLDAEALVKVWKSVARYCLQDTIQAAILFLRSRHLLGRVTEEEYNLSLSTFADDPIIDEALPMDWDLLCLQ